jgi:CelD/BcsL family acetyltransferase involved in cellulose biosynthesis
MVFPFVVLDWARPEPVEVKDFGVGPQSRSIGNSTEILGFGLRNAATMGGSEMSLQGAYKPQRALACGGDHVCVASL